MAEDAPPSQARESFSGFRGENKDSQNHLKPSNFLTIPSSLKDSGLLNLGKSSAISPDTIGLGNSMHSKNSFELVSNKKAPSNPSENLNSFVSNLLGKSSAKL